jgi:hypothetical protein
MSRIENLKVLQAENLLLRVVLPISTVSVFLGCLQAWVKTFYYGDAYNQRIGWLAQDGNWASHYAFGVHYFGDYFLMNQMALNSEPWATGNNYPPFAMAIFRIFAFIPYRISLILWIVFAIVCVVAPLVHATRGFSVGIRIQLVFLVGLLSAPVIGTLDRGNNIFLLVPLLYFGFNALVEDKKYKASVLLGIACAVKLYPLLILLFLILKRKWTVSFLSGFVMVALSILAALYWGNPITKIKEALIGAAAYDGISSSGQPMLFSFVGLFNNFLIAVGLDKSTFSNSVVTSPRLFGAFFLMFLLLVSAGVNEFQTYLLAITTIQFVPSNSYTYTRIWTIIAIALLLKYHSETFNLQESNDKKKYFWWWCAILATNTLISVWSLHPMSLIAELPLLALLIILIKSFKLDLILLGLKSMYSDLRHVIKKSLNSLTAKNFNS